MTGFSKVGSEQIALLAVGAGVCMIVPVIIALIWRKKKNEPLTSILAGAVGFMLFAIALEKPIQNALVFPTLMGLPETAFSRFLSANPLLWALTVSLFPGLFEETGRLVVFKTFLRKRKNRETSVSYGIGHGGIEVILAAGITYATYAAYGVMINSGSFQTLVDRTVRKAPEQVASIYAVVRRITSFSPAGLAQGLFERVFAVLFHIGASMMAFYACRDRRYGLYFLAVMLHTCMDLIAALQLAGLIHPSPIVFEGMAAVFGSRVFFSAYMLLYRKDTQRN